MYKWKTHLDDQILYSPSRIRLPTDMSKCFHLDRTPEELKKNVFSNLKLESNSPQSRCQCVSHVSLNKTIIENNSN